MPTLPSTHCDACGRAMAKAQARWEGKAYCRACYKRCFVRVPCQDCGRPVGVPTGVPHAQCKSCRTKHRPCVRCGKPTPRAGLLVEQGAVCASCARYFKPAQPCPACGQPSLHLARDFKAGFTEPVCPACRRKDFITCPGCGKHRKPAGRLEAGPVVCAHCLASNGRMFVCPQCGQRGRRHSRHRCAACYWRDTARERLKNAVVLLRNEWIRQLFADFIEELIDRVSPQKAALKLNRYFLFFARLDSSVERPSALTPGRIAALFDVDSLRRHAIPYGYLAKRGVVPLPADPLLRTAQELERQRRLIDQVRETWYGDLLERYHHHLLAIADRYERRGWRGPRQRFVPRTITQNLRAASVLLDRLNHWEVQSTPQILQLHVDRFLAEHAGYRDGIRSFLRFLNRKEKLFRRLTIVTIRRHLPSHAFLDERQYQTLLGAWLAPDDRHLKGALICLLMALYAQPIRRLVRLRLSDLQHDPTGTYRVLFGRVEIPLHPAVGALLTRYLQHRTALSATDDPWRNDYLFTGRHHGGHLSEAAVGGYLREYGVTAQALYTTAIYQAYVQGIRHPKSLVQAFGLDAGTATKYLALIDPRLRAEVEKKASRE